MTHSHTISSARDAIDAETERHVAALTVATNDDDRAAARAGLSALNGEGVALDAAWRGRCIEPRTARTLPVFLEANARLIAEDAAEAGAARRGGAGLALSVADGFQIDDGELRALEARWSEVDSRLDLRRQMDDTARTLLVALER